MISVRGVARAAVVGAMVMLAAGAAQAIAIDMVTVGNPGNAGELSGSGAVGYGGWQPNRICGAVAYTYNIGKYEVTAGQYTAFLNAVAKTDTYGLYSTSMASTGMENPSYGSLGCNIQRSGSWGSYTYSVVSDWANRPVNYVTFWDACRFANWLNNGQQGAGTTEYGAYSLNGVTDPTDLIYMVNAGYTSITRNTGAQWAVTSEDEWYKAAYYDPTTGTYFDYPTSSNSISTAMANYNMSVGHTTDVGSYPYASPYGTFDQGGNVWELNETIIDAPCCRGWRGGAFNFDGNNLQASYRDYYNAADCGYSFAGFRVSEVPGPVPEPVTMATLGMGIVGLCGYIRRRMAK